MEDLDMEFLTENEIFEVAKLFLEKEIEADLRKEVSNDMKITLKKQRAKWFDMLKERRENKTGA